MQRWGLWVTLGMNGGQDLAVRGGIPWQISILAHSWYIFTKPGILSQPLVSTKTMVGSWFTSVTLLMLLPNHTTCAKSSLTSSCWQPRWAALSARQCITRPSPPAWCSSAGARRWTFMTFGLPTPAWWIQVIPEAFPVLPFSDILPREQSQGWQRVSPWLWNLAVGICWAGFPSCFGPALHFIFHVSLSRTGMSITIFLCLSQHCMLRADNLFL